MEFAEKTPLTAISPMMSGRTLPYEGESWAARPILDGPRPPQIWGRRADQPGAKVFERQLKVLEAGEMYKGDKISGSTTTATVARLKKCVSELNELLKEYGRAPPP
jgi:hypothetical protein